MLLDRHAERAVLDRLLDAARGGRSGVVVVRGEAGVGKTALLDYAVQSAAGMRIARLAGIESEMELSFAALQQCCLPILDLLERLPEPQRDALGVAFGLRAGQAPDPFLVGLAALSLLSETVEDQPLLCVIDDAQWLDRASAQAVGFVARRMLAEPVALVIAEREPGEHFRGLPELLVEGLGHDDARELLDSVARGPPGRRSAAAACRRGGASRRPGAGVAGGRTARDRGGGIGGRGGQRVADDRRAGYLPASAGEVGGVPGRDTAGRKAGGAPGAGRRH